MSDPCSLLQASTCVGNAITITSEHVRGNARSVFRSRGESEHGRAMALQLGIDTTGALEGDAALAPIIARIRWGQGGASCELEVDWAVGTVITLPTSYVEVVAYVDQDWTATPVPVPEPFGDVQISASIAEGTAGATGLCATRTTVPFDVTAAPKDIEIPPYAKAWMWSSNTQLDNPDVSFLGGPGGRLLQLIGSGDLDYGQSAGTPPRIPAHARYMRIANDSPIVSSIQWFLQV